MLYPFKFDPVLKDYIWGGRKLEKLGKKLPEGIIAESWEISSHPDGVSTVCNGEFKGQLLTYMIERYGKEIVGTEIYSSTGKFPLLIKFIDANDKLSIQVHPNDEYAKVNENGELGKNEMWYILAAKPGAKLVYGIRPGITAKDFRNAVNENRIEECLNEVEVYPGDVLNIPAGLVHAIGEGILLAEIQQNSNTTYRVFDYNRTDKNGNKRPLHIDKALEVIDFNFNTGNAKTTGLNVKIDSNSVKSYKIANKYFSVELYDVNGLINEKADGRKFHIYVFVDGDGEIRYSGGKIQFSMGESVLIPACLGEYALEGRFKALKTYVPDVQKDIISPLIDAGYSREEILENVSGLK